MKLTITAIISSLEVSPGRTQTFPDVIVALTALRSRLDRAVNPVELNACLSIRVISDDAAPPLPDNLFISYLRAGAKAAPVRAQQNCAPGALSRADYLGIYNARAADLINNLAVRD